MYTVKRMLNGNHVNMLFGREDLIENDTAFQWANSH